MMRCQLPQLEKVAIWMVWKAYFENRHFISEEIPPFERKKHSADFAKDSN